LQKAGISVSFSHRLVVFTFKSLTSLICRIDDAELERIPQKGPLIIYTNHVNILEIPIIYTHIQPRRLRGMALADRWNNPVLGWILDVVEAIPLQRGEPDIIAIRRGLKVLEKGEILGISPEGTRSHDGILQPGHPGVVLLALHSGAPLIPVAYFGAENYTKNLRRLRRTDFHLRVGKPFHLDTRGEKVTREIREKMTEEMMYQLAVLLPSEYRGRYTDSSALPTHYIRFD
jgi:1-acyl-sn-glycerol-3-phosphate acyltransferase